MNITFKDRWPDQIARATNGWLTLALQEKKTLSNSQHLKNTNEFWMISNYKVHLATPQLWCQLWAATSPFVIPTPFSDVKGAIRRSLVAVTSRFPLIRTEDRSPTKVALIGALRTAAFLVNVTKEIVNNTDLLFCSNQKKMMIKATIKSPGCQRRKLEIAQEQSGFSISWRCFAKKVSQLRHPAWISPRVPRPMEIAIVQRDGAIMIRLLQPHGRWRSWHGRRWHCKW